MADECCNNELCGRVIFCLQWYDKLGRRISQSDTYDLKADGTCEKIGFTEVTREPPQVLHFSRVGDPDSWE